MPEYNVEKQNLAERFGGMPDAPMMTSRDGNSASERRYQRKMAAWEGQRAREMEDAQLERQRRLDERAMQMQDRDQVLQEAAALRTEEEYQTKQELRARAEHDSIGLLRAIRGGKDQDGNELPALNPQSEDFPNQIVALTERFPMALENETAKASLSMMDKAHNTWLSAKEANARREESRTDRDFYQQAGLAQNLAAAGVSDEEAAAFQTGTDEQGNPTYDLVAANKAIGAKRRETTLQRPEQSTDRSIESDVRSLNAKIAGKEKEIEALGDEALPKDLAELEGLKGQVEALKAESKPKAESPKERPKAPTKKLSDKDIETAKRIASDPSDPKNKAAIAALRAYGIE